MGDPLVIVTAISTAVDLVHTFGEPLGARSRTARRASTESDDESSIVGRG
jgi:hypothetical protein